MQKNKVHNNNFSKTDIHNINLKDNKKTFSEKSAIGNILNSDTSFAVTEAYKLVRTNLKFSLAASEKSRVIVTSALPGEGKSTTSINLAITMSQIDAKVLLIDADLRKATVHKKLNLTNKLGLTSILGGFCKVEEALHKNVIENLDVITSGPIPPNPAELLGSNIMSYLLEACDKVYDYVIIDTPPVNVVSDVVALCPEASGVVFVVREGVTRHDELTRAISSIEFTNTKVLGMVLNSAYVGKSSGYKNKYKYKYKY